MQPDQYRKQFHKELADFLSKNEAGKPLPYVLNQARPALSCKPTPEQTIWSNAYAAGWEACISFLVSLSMPPLVKTEVEPSYGLDKKTLKEAKKEGEL
jgi:hypothetical protein